jgi:ferric-dicitrate binding protein FerR (iron transport regulator)
MVCSTGTLAQMLLSRPVVLDPAQATDGWFRLDAKLRAATRAPNARSAHRATSDRSQASSPPKPRRPSSRSRRAAARRKTALAQLVFALVLLGGFLAYGPQISTAVGEVLAEQFTKGLTSSTPSR